MAHPIEVGKSVSIIDANSTNIWPITSTNNIFYVVPSMTIDNPENREYSGEYANPVTGNMIVYSYDTSTQNNSVFRNYICKSYNTKQYPDTSVLLNNDTDINDPAKSQMAINNDICNFGVVTRIENMQYGKDSSIQLPAVEGIKFPAPNQKVSIMNVHITPIEKLMTGAINSGNLDETIKDAIKFDYDNLKFVGDVSTSKKIEDLSLIEGRNKISVTIDVSVIRLRDAANPKNGNKIEANDGNISIFSGGAGTRVFKTKNYQYSNPNYNIGQINSRYRPKWQEGVTNTQYNIAYIEDLEDEHNYLQNEIDILLNKNIIEDATDVSAGHNISVQKIHETNLNTFVVSTTDDITVENLTVNNTGIFNNASVRHTLQNGEPYFSLENNEYLHHSSTTKNIYGSSSPVESAILDELALYNPIRISANSRILFSGHWPAGNNAAWGERAPINIEWNAPNSKAGGRNYWGKSPKDGQSYIINGDTGNPSLPELKYWNHGTFPIISSQVGKNDQAWIDLSTYGKHVNGNPYVDVRINSGDDGIQRIVVRQTTYYEVLDASNVSNMTRKEAFAKVLRSRFFSRDYPPTGEHAWYVIEILDSSSEYIGNGDWNNRRYVTSSFSTISSISYNNNIDSLAQIKEDDIAAVCRLTVDNNGNLPVSSLSGTIFNKSWFNSTVGNECYKIYTAASNLVDYGETATGNPDEWILACVINPHVGTKEFANTGAEAILLDNEHNTQFPGTLTCNKLVTSDFSLNGNGKKFILNNGASGASIPLRTKITCGNTYISKENAQLDPSEEYYVSNIPVPSCSSTLTVYVFEVVENTTGNNYVYCKTQVPNHDNYDIYKFKFDTKFGINILHVDITYRGAAGTKIYGFQGINNYSNGRFYEFRYNAAYSNSPISDWITSLWGNGNIFNNPNIIINQSVISTSAGGGDVSDDDAQFGVVYSYNPSTATFGIERWRNFANLDATQAHIDFIWI